MPSYEQLSIGDQRRFDVLEDTRGIDVAHANFGTSPEQSFASQLQPRYRKQMTSAQRRRLVRAATGPQPGDDRFIIPAEGAPPDFNWHPDPDAPGKTMSETPVDIAGNIERGREESLRKYRPEDEAVQATAHDPAAMVEAALRSWDE